MMGSFVKGIFGETKGPQAAPTVFSQLPASFRQPYLSYFDTIQNLQNRPSSSFVVPELPAEALAADYATQGVFGPGEFGGAVQEYINPYQDQVVGGLLDDLETRTQGMLSNIKEDFSGAGMFGSTRQDVYNREAIKDFNKEASRIAGGLLSDYYNQASNMAMQNRLSGIDAARGLQGFAATQGQRQLQRQMPELSQAGIIGGLLGSVNIPGLGSTSMTQPYNKPGLLDYASKAAPLFI